MKGTGRFVAAQPYARWVPETPLDAPHAWLILPNEAGMLLIISHFVFWNSEKAGMLLKTIALDVRKPECR
jgi:hypothetical protein